MDSYDSYPQPNGHHQPLADSLHYKLTPACERLSFLHFTAQLMFRRQRSKLCTVGVFAVPQSQCLCQQHRRAADFLFTIVAESHHFRKQHWGAADCVPS